TPRAFGRDRRMPITNKYQLGSAQSGVWSAVSGVRSAECGVRSLECGVCKRDHRAPKLISISNLKFPISDFRFETPNSALRTPNSELQTPHSALPSFMSQSDQRIHTRSSARGYITRSRGNTNHEENSERNGDRIGWSQPEQHALNEARRGDRRAHSNRDSNEDKKHCLSKNQTDH